MVTTHSALFLLLVLLIGQIATTGSRLASALPTQLVPPAPSAQPAPLALDPVVSSQQTPPKRATLTDSAARHFSQDRSLNPQPTSSSLPISEILIGLGYTYKLPNFRNGPLRVVHGENLSIRQNQGQWEILGKKLGYSLLHTGTRTWRIRVIREAHYFVYQKLVQWQVKQPSLAVTYQNQEFIISGLLQRFADWLEICDLVQPTTPMFFRARTLPLVQADANLFFQKLMRQKQLVTYPLQWSPHPEIYLAREDEAELARYRKLLACYGIPVLVGQKISAPRPLVKTRLYLTEIRKSFLQRVGLSWPQQLTAQFIPASVVTKDLALTLEGLEQSGEAKIIASPTLLIESGKSGTFFSGGEIPIKSSTARHQRVQWKKHGLQIKLQPTLQAHGALHYQIFCEISYLDSSHALEGIPAIASHQTQTEIRLAQPRAILLSGLLRNERGQHQDGLAFLSALPGLGSLFRREDQRREASEIVVFLEPEILETHASATGDP